MINSIIGQNHIKAYIKDKTLGTLPRSLLLIGKKGCGKHLFTRAISDYFQLEYEDITDWLSLDTVNNILIRTQPTFYLINVSDIAEKDQNVILKFIEEPAAHTYIILLAESKNQVLDTVYNRCQVLEFTPYSEEELLNFTKDPNVVKICKTPGQVKLCGDINFEELVTLCDKVCTKISQSNVSNVLTIADKIAFKNEKNKFDLDVFLSALSYKLKEYIVAGHNEYFSFYNILRDYNEKRINSSLQQKALFEQFLLNLYKRETV